MKINKYYGGKLEDGAIFEIYDIANNLVGTYKTENGIINIKLEYGEYELFNCSVAIFNSSLSVIIRT